MRIVLSLFFLTFASPYAVASGPWDGLWYYDADQSRFSDHTYTLSKLPNGRWKYDGGANSFIFAANGKPYPLSPGSAFTFTVTTLTDQAFDSVWEGYGRVFKKEHEQLAADGKTMKGRLTYIYPDGHEADHETLAIRVSGTSGFEGTWKVPANAGNSDKTKPSAKGGTGSAAGGEPQRPFWVISTSADGTMSWYIPATGELIRGKTDGQPRPITGPQADSTTFVWKQTSPYRIEFYASFYGHLAVRAVETLSPDGKTFTDTLWTIGHDKEKDIRVFHKKQ